MVTIDTQENSNVDMQSIIDEISQTVLQNADLSYKLRDLGENIWTLRIRNRNGQRPARIEIVIDEFTDPEDRGARGAVFSYGDIPRNQVAMIMDAIMERI